MAENKASSGKFAAILLLSFLAGAGVMVLEICASRLLSPYFGNSIFVWGSLIGIVLFALSAGYLLGGHFADKFPSEKVLFAIVSLSGIFVFLVPILGSFAFSFSRKFGYVFGPLVASAIVFLPASVLLGAVSPFSLKLVAGSGKKSGGLGRTSGLLYAVSTAGSLAGTFLATFFFAPFLGTRETILGLGTVLFFSGAIALVFFSGKRRTLLALIPVFILSLLLAKGAPSFGSSRLVSQNSVLVHSEESLYQRIVVFDSPLKNDSEKFSRILTLDSLVSGGMRSDDVRKSPYEYPACFSLAYSINPEIKSALFVGGGTFSLPRIFLSGDPSLSIDVVEIDPAVVRVAESYFNLSKSPGFNIFIGEGRSFLESNPEKKYDFIGIDAYLSGRVPAHMLTVEFFRLVKERLSENGTIAINVVGAAEGEFSKSLAIEKNTLSRVFPSVYVFPVGRIENRSQVTTVLLFGSNNEVAIPSEFLKKRAYGTAERMGIPEIPNCVNNYLPETLSGDSDGNGAVFTDNFSPINNLIEPEMSSIFLLG